MKLAVDTLMALPFAERMRAYEDFDIAVAKRLMARAHLRMGGAGWRFDHALDMRAALRHWRRYSRAVRKARAIHSPYHERLAA